MKKIIAMLLALSMVLAMAACGGSSAPATEAPKTEAPASGETATEAPAATEAPENLTATQKIIKEAEGMTLEELAKKAIEESNGKMFYGVGNSSRGKSALPKFIEYLQTIDPSYTMEFEWQQPKNNKIFDQLTADSLKGTGTFAMTLIQDGNQIESKMVQPGVLDTFIPKDWADANGTTADAYTGFLPLQTLNKVFMYNNTGSKTYDNCWDFVAEGEHGLYMDIDSEIVGKNFLYMLTEDTYAGWLKEAFDALSADEQAYFQPTIQAMPMSRTSPSRRESRVNNASIPAVRAIRAPPEGRGALPCERLMGISLIKRRPGAGWDRDRARGTSKKASGRKRRPAGGSCVTVCADRFPYARPGQRPGRRRPFPRACP